MAAQNSTNTPLVKPNNLPRLTDINAIRKLSPEDLERGFPVSLEGRVIQAIRNRSQILLQIGDSGLPVYLTERRGLTTIGQKVRVEGFTVAQRQVQVLCNKLTVVDPTVELPAPKTLTIKEAMTNPPKYCRVKLTGVVVSAQSRPLRHELLVRDQGYTFPVQVYRQARVAKPDEVIDSRMTFVGVITDTPTDHEDTGARLLVRGWNDAQTLQPAPVIPFNRSRKPIASVLKTKQGQGPEFRVRLRGEGGFPGGSQGVHGLAES
ncbi:MAG: hypothetical protein ACPGVU_24985, partial [Limisphaerales bacterium]